VAYGHYDLNRLLNTLTVAIDNFGSAVVAIERGGLHAAEAIIMARYMMFTQVYFHKTRRAYDYHIAEALQHLLEVESKSHGNILADGHFLPPTSPENLQSYLAWDDWRVLGCFDRNEAGEHGLIIKNRDHHRMVFETSECPTEEEQNQTKEVLKKLSKFSPKYDNANASWYKFEKLDIPLVIREGTQERVENLSRYSSLVRGLKSVSQMRVYVPLKNRNEAKKELFN
jgi:HD superfamily phosphohydrolase